MQARTLRRLLACGAPHQGQHSPLNPFQSLLPPQVTPKNPAKLRKTGHRTRSGTASDDPVMRWVWGERGGGRADGAGGVCGRAWPGLASFISR